MPTDKQLVLDLIDAFNKRDYVKLQSVYAAGCSGSAPGTPLQGRVQFIALFERYWHSFPDCRLVVNFLIAEDAIVAVHYTFFGTSIRSFGGYPPTGCQLRVPGAIFNLIKGSQIFEQYLIWDDLGPRRQEWLATFLQKTVAE